ncbi:MAG: double zinc ribbon domain-containing protein, partial [Myxococcales bacterium]
NGTTGREATVTSDGGQLAVQDGRHRTRTDGCWSDNPRVRRISASHTGTRWTVICQTADEDYQHEQGTYTIQVDGTHLTMRESSEYSWQLRESRCRASASRTLVFERAPDANPTPVVDAGRAVATNPPPPTNRCATPGAPARLQISPGRRPLAPGGRGCFRARFLDTNSCEVTAGLPTVGWSMTRSGGNPNAPDAVMENVCVRAPAGSTVGEYTVTATAGPLTATAIASVVSAEELQSLVAAQFEDEDAGVPALAPTAAASGTGVGAIVVQTPPPPPGTSRSGSFLWILMGLGAALAVAGVLLLTGKKKKPARTSLNPDRPSDPSAASSRVRRHSEAMPIKELRTPAKPPAPAAAPPSEANPLVAPRPLVKRCPQCNARFTAEIAFCPEHGTALVSDETPAAVPGHATVIAGSGGLPSSTAICPRCSQPVEPGAQFCPRDGTPILGPSPALPLLCPRCRRRFQDGTAFCGEDGSALVRD